MQNDKIGNPMKHYQHPNEIDADISLSIEEKIKGLENWLDDIRLKMIAEDENMACTITGPKYFTKEIMRLLEKYASQQIQKTSPQTPN